MGKTHGIRSVLGSILVVLLGFNSSASYYDIQDSTDLTFQKVRALIEESNAQSIEDTLAEIKKDYPEFFENYVLMYHSRSLQTSSFQAPRALLLDPSGRFVFSFNGNSLQRGYNSLEIMEYKEGDERFEFREIVFSNNEKPQFSEANPAKCLACHQSPYRRNVDPRPNWEPYNIWPGAYGSMSGSISVGNYERDILKKKNADPLIYENAQQEKENIEVFLNQTLPKHPRYQFLEKDKFDPHKTVELTQMLTRLALRRVVRIISQDYPKVFQAIEPTFYASIYCGKLALSEEAISWIRSESDEEYDGRPYTYSGSNGSMLVSQALHDLFEPLGISTEDWSLDFKTGGRLAFYERFGTPGNTSQLMREAITKVLGPPTPYVCKDLEAESILSFDLFSASSLFQELSLAKEKLERTRQAPILDRCVKCHTSGDRGIPQIPFDKPELLKPLLAQPLFLGNRILMDEIRYRVGDYAQEHERMPLGPIATRAQRQELLRYLESLMDEE